MTTSNGRRKRKEAPACAPSVTHLTPDRVTDIAYCFYVVMSNNHGAATPDIELAQKIVDEFNRLRDSFPPDSPEGVFLFTVSQIIISLSRGIARCKQNKLSRLRAAEEAKAERMRMISESARRAGFIRASIRTAITGGFGYYAVQAVVPSVHLEPTADSKYISLATALGLVLISSYIGAWWASVKVTRIFMYHQFVISYAEKEYDAAALEEYERADQNSRRAWEIYANTPAACWPNYATQIREERRVRDVFEEKYLVMISDPVTVAFGLLKRPLSALKRMTKRRPAGADSSA